ncbi:MAG: hypothetical protein ACK518_01775, partial [bacterium]
MDIVEKLILDDSQFQSAAQKTIDTMNKMGQASIDAGKKAQDMGNSQAAGAQNAAKATQAAATAQQQSMMQMLKAKELTLDWNATFQSRMDLVAEYEKKIMKTFQEEHKKLRESGGTLEDVSKLYKQQSVVWDEWRKMYQEAANSAKDFGAVQNVTNKTVSQNTKILYDDIIATIKSRDSIEGWNKSAEDRSKLIEEWTKKLKEANKASVSGELSDKSFAQAKVERAGRNEATDLLLKAKMEMFAASEAGAEDISALYETQAKETTGFIGKLTNSVKGFFGAIGNAVSSSLGVFTPFFRLIGQGLGQINVFGTDLGTVGDRIKDFASSTLTATKALFTSSAATNINTVSTTTNTAARGTNTTTTAANTASTLANAGANTAATAATTAQTAATTALTAAKRIATVTMKLFGAAVAATGIGALLVALGSLAAYFKNTDEGANKLRLGLAYIKGAIDPLIDAFSNIGKTISEAFENPSKAIDGLWESIKTNLLNRVKSIPAFFMAIGTVIEKSFKFDWDGAKNGLKEVGQAAIQFGTGFDVEQQNKFADALGDVVDKAKATGAAMKELEKAKMAVEKASGALETREALLSSQIEQSKRDAEDLNKSYLQRMSAAKNAFGLEGSLLGEKIDLQKESLRIAISQNNILGDSAEGQKIMNEENLKLNELINKQKDSERLLQEKINAIIKEAAGLYKQMRSDILSEAKAIGLLTDEMQFDVLKEETLEKLNTYKKS